MMNDLFEVTLGDVTDMEARVYARYKGPQVAALRGSLRGPFCESARTLPADFPFRPVPQSKDGALEAIVTDPCMWTNEMPHLYQVRLEAREGERLIAEYQGTIGFERRAPRRPVDFAPGTG